MKKRMVCVRDRSMDCANEFTIECDEKGNFPLARLKQEVESLMDAYDGNTRFEVFELKHISTFVKQLVVVEE